MSKKRILLVNECSSLPTGYGTYGHNLLSHLFKNPNYTIAELGYGNSQVPETKWKYYSNHPNPGEEQAFESRMENRFGAFKFNQVCLDFQPSHVITITDPWMSSNIKDSPYRKYFRWIQKAILDAEPQTEEWIDQFGNSDVCVPYTNWGRKVLEKQGGSLINLHDEPCGAGVDTEVFRPMDKSKAREFMRIDEDLFIVGMSSRNQHRKLYPNLFEAFRKFLDTAPKEITKKSYLYVHTTYPDLGWNIPELLKRNSLGSKVLFTYICHHCNHVTASFFRDSRSICYNCKTSNAMFPTTHYGVTREQLAVIMNTFDIFCQYSTNEGFGMNQAEAASCGIPVMAPDYSGMADILDNTNGMGINILKYDTHIEFGCKRVIPDDSSFCDILTHYYYDKSNGFAEQASQDARNGVLKHYTWEKVGQVWTDAIDSVEALPFKQSWGSPKDFHIPPNLPQAKFPNMESFVKWCFINILNRPEGSDSYFAMRLIRDLNLGMRPVTVPGSSYISENSGFGNLNNNQVPFTMEEVLQNLLKIRENINGWETLRVSVTKGPIDA